ncbi:PAS domain-containing hybrid sensor histidine kinase/response regulator [Azospirillum sp. ST 5-10]|uniref:hybrid sensor histidine kinase/response regulator n=1 Tax=unclassified Azospirillum TaxID=2630922 RepID=UPI003F4A080E
MSDERLEGLRRRAEAVITEGGFDSSSLAAGTFKEIVHELYVHQAELEIQNEELRNAQQTLEVSRREYVQLFQALPLACFTVNAAGIVGEANPAAERQFRLPHRQLKGRPLTLLVASYDHGRLFAALSRLRESGTWTAQEYVFVGADGPIDGLTSGHRVALEDGDKGDVLLTITDVTERNVWVRELQAARDEADRNRAAYHHILQSVSEGLCGVDEEGTVTFANAAALSITGFTTADLVGGPAGALFAGRNGAAAALAASLRDGTARTVAQQTMRRHDGSTFAAEVSVSPLVEHTRLTGAVLSFRDVTARLAAEEALRVSEERHRTLVQSLHEGVVLHDATGRRLVTNAMAERLLAGPAAALLDPRAETLDEEKGSGRRFIDTDGSRLQGLPPAARALREGRPVIEQVVGIATGDGVGAAAGDGATWLRISSHPVDGNGGRFEAVVTSVSDITAIKAMERDLNVALDAKERFMASASHDLRQPVQALTLFSDLLLKERLPAKARRFAEQLRDSVGALGSMLDCLLDISRLEAGLVTPVIARVDLHGLMSRLQAEFEPLAASSGLRLRCVPTRAALDSDGALLERVLRNLLSNALRYTRSGRVLFGTRRHRGRLRLEVWDTGIGIAENQIDRIFQDFYQVGNLARDRREGLGMGLSIAKRLIAMLGGTMDVRSTLGKGSCFAVSLPLAAAPATPPAARPADGDGRAEGGEDALVLLVEDDAVIRMALAMMLEGWGYRVVEAGSVREALGHLNDHGLKPDLLLADYRLPDGETGLMLMDTVRRRLGGDTPGILLTGDTSSDRLREASAAQCALLHKPIQPGALEATVRASLARRDGA